MDILQKLKGWKMINGDITANFGRKEVLKRFNLKLTETFEERFFDATNWQVAIFLSFKSGITENELKDRYGTSEKIGNNYLEIQSSKILTDNTDLFANLISIVHNRKIDIKTELATFLKLHSRHGFDLLEKEMNENSSIIDFFLNQLEPPTDLDIQKPTTNFLEKLKDAISEIKAPLEFVEEKSFKRTQKFYFKIQDINYVTQLFKPDFKDKLEVATSLNLYIEKTNQDRTVSINILKEHNPIQLSDSEISTNDLVLNIGMNNEDEIVKADISEMPHLLVAGTTGSGKTVFLHSSINQLLKKDIELYLIDGKNGFEFGKYQNAKVISDSDEIFSEMANIVDEMETRYSNSETIHKPIIVIIDEFVDLIMQNKDIETQFIRLAQKGRGVKIHLILATQRPDSKIMQGVLRSNIPSRIAFKVQKSNESKIILDEVGAENLLGKGDMLFSNGKILQRLQGFFGTN